MKKFLLMAIAAIFAFSAASAQDKGNWAVGPKLGIYTNTGFDGAVLGIGASGRYSFTDNWRIEPTLMAICEDDCSIDLNVNVHYLFNIADCWAVYPQAGISANDLGDWSCGFNFGAGTDFRLARHWDLTADFKWMVQTHKYWKNPIVISLGATYKF